MKIECPHCHHSGDVPDTYAGRIAKCNCGKSFTVPQQFVIAPDPKQEIQQIKTKALINCLLIDQVMKVAGCLLPLVILIIVIIGIVCITVFGK